MGGRLRQGQRLSIMQASQQTELGLHRTGLRSRATRATLQRPGRRRQFNKCRAFLPVPAAQTLPFLQPIANNPAGLLVAAAVMLSIRLERARADRQWQSTQAVSKEHLLEQRLIPTASYDTSDPGQGNSPPCYLLLLVVATRSQALGYI